MESIELEITIDRDGRTQVHIKGIKGAGCESVAQALGDILGRVEERRTTEEFYEPPNEVRIDLRARGR